MLLSLMKTQMPLRSRARSRLAPRTTVLSPPRAARTRQTVGTANNATPSAAGQSVSASVQPVRAANAPAQPVRAANPAVQPAQGGAAPQGMAANAVHPTAQPNGTATASAQPIPAHPVPGTPVPPMGGSGPSVGAAQEAVGAQNAQAFARPTRQAAPEFVSAGQPVPLQRKREASAFEYRASMGDRAVHPGAGVVSELCGRRVLPRGGH